MNKTLLGLLTFVLTVVAASARGQTVQGDILRGEGRYLQGAGWYNFNTARADRINVETWKAYNREVQRLYRDYMIDRYRHIQYKKGLTNKLQAEIQRRFEEDERRWRTSPTPADILSGDALNALAGDLADPSIAPSSWRVKPIALPSDITLTALSFKIADTRKSSLSQGTVAIDRMLVPKEWPLPFRRPEIEGECATYKKAVAAVVDKCRNGSALQAADYERLRDAVGVLQKAVETSVPTRDNQRSIARDYVRRLDETSKIFAEQEYAEQLIRDVSAHRATTVAELLAFMRDYRLLFADSGSAPEVTSLYETLYGLLRSQKEALDVRDPPAPSDLFKTGTVWVDIDPKHHRRLRVVDRDGNQFKALYILGKERDTVREVKGEVGNNTVSWLAKDTRQVKGPPPKQKSRRTGPGIGYDYHGTFRGHEIQVTFTENGNQVRYTLRKAE